MHKDNERSGLLDSELAESYLHDGVQVLSGRGHGAGVHRRALGHYGDVMVGVLGECRRRDDDRGVVGGRRGRQHLEGEKTKIRTKADALKKNPVCSASNRRLFTQLFCPRHVW